MADEIEVEGEPWTGLIVVMDDRWGKGIQNRYGLVQASEWKWTGDPKDPNREVTVWKGPRKPDEKIRRRDLSEVECRTVLVDKKGFYTCPPPMSEGIEQLVRDLAEPLLNRMGNERAAEASSYVHDGYEDDFGDEDVWVKSEYGGQVAVNGELVFNKKRLYPPNNWVETDQGGRDPMGMEEEIDLESLVETLVREGSDKLGYPVDPVLVRAAVVKEYKPRDGYFSWNSSGGRTEVWTTKKGLEHYEKLKRESQAAARERKDREIREARAREAAERKLRIRKGGFPSPKDWSPTGEL